jgi:hypothetical protein
VGQQPGQVRCDEMFWIIRVVELDPLTGEVQFDFARVPICHTAQR